MQTLTANDAKRNFGELLLNAQREPIKISKNSKDAVVVMSIHDYEELEMMLVGNHAPFTWGKDAAKSVYHAVILEEIARMAYLTRTLAPQGDVLARAVMDKHYFRKHGKNAYYGQSK